MVVLQVINVLAFISIDLTISFVIVVYSIVYFNVYYQKLMTKIKQNTDNYL